MPYLKIQTNVKIGDKQKWMSEATTLLSDMLGKPSAYIMVVIQDEQAMMFAGGSGPLAFAELKSIGLPENETKALSSRLCDFIESTTGIPSDRIYIEFSNARGHMFGWNGSTFG